MNFIFYRLTDLQRLTRKVTPMNIITATKTTNNMETIISKNNFCLLEVTTSLAFVQRRQSLINIITKLFFASPPMPMPEKAVQPPALGPPPTPLLEFYWFNCRHTSSNQRLVKATSPLLERGSLPQLVRHPSKESN